MRCKEFKTEYRISFKSYEEANRFDDFLEGKDVYLTMFGKSLVKPPVYLYIPKYYNRKLTLEEIEGWVEEYIANPPKPRLIFNTLI